MIALKEKVKERIIRNFEKTRTYSRKDIVDDLLSGDPFDFSPAWEKKFLETMRFSFRHHSINSEFYKKLCALKGFNEKKLASFEDIWDIPYIMSDVFKFYSMDTKTSDLVRTEITSSGTSGRKSRVMLNIISGKRLLSCMYQIYKALGLSAPDTLTNYIMMAYNPEIDRTRATTNSDIIISSLTPRNRVFYALDKTGGEETRFLLEETVEELKSFIDEGLPIRILGFLHHTCEVIKMYRKKYGPAEFPKGSYILSGGGWKSFAHLYGDGFDLFGFLKENTTIDLKNVRDLYTLNEHPVFYLECEEHNMHVPNMALACIRDPRTLKRLSAEETGLIHLYTPLIESSPLLSILTTDYGYVKESCACGRKGRCIKIIGRAGVTKKVTCTLTADQYIKNEK